MGTFFLAPTKNYTQKALNGSINDSVQTITLNNTTDMQAPGYVVIDRVNSAGLATPNTREVISYTGISGNDLTGCTRGADGSTARSHDDTAIVETMPTVGMWNNLATIVSTGFDNNGYLRAINSPVSIGRAELTQIAVTSVASIARLEMSILNTARTAITSIASITRIETNALLAASVASIALPQIALMSTKWTAFTPTFSGTGGSAGTFAQDSAFGRYSQIGKLLYFNIYVRITNVGSWSGDVQLGYPPVAMSTNAADKAQFPVFLTAQSSNPITAAKGIGVSISANASIFNFKSSVGAAVLQWSGVSNNDTVFGQGFYEVD